MMSKMKGNMNEKEAILNEAKEICETVIFHNINLIYHIIGLFIGFVGFLFFSIFIFIFLGTSSFDKLLSAILITAPLLFLSAMSLGGLLGILFNIYTKSSKEEILSKVSERLTEKLGYKDINITIEKEIGKPSLVVLQGHATFETDNTTKTSEIIIAVNTLDGILCVKVRDPNTVIYDSCSC